MGRPPKIWKCDQLGVLLFYLASKMTYKYLALLFGTGEGKISKILKKLLVKVVVQLKGNHAAQVRLPNETECTELVELVVNRE
jgi:hypothetical protein